MMELLIFLRIYSPVYKRINYIYVKINLKKYIHTYLHQDYF